MSRPGLPLASALALAALTAVSPALAQRLPTSVPLDSGALVRLHLDDGTVVRGRLLRPLTVDSREIEMCRYPAPPCAGENSPRALRLDAGSIEALDVQRGTRVRRGAAIGAGIGAVLGWLSGSLYNGLCDHVGCGVSLTAWIVHNAAVAALWGALFGSQSVVWARPPPPGG